LPKTKLQSKKWKRLFKLASNGKSVVEWDISVQENENGTATLTTVFGQRDGKKQTIDEQFKKGKNIGRANETTPYQQAVSEAESKWNKKKDRGNYSTKIADCGEKRSRAPMLALVYEDHPPPEGDWVDSFAQPKLDGFRCLARCSEDEVITLESREGKPIETMEHIIEELAEVMGPGEVFDGELYIHGEKFQRLCSLIKKKQAGSDRVAFHIYDNPTLYAEPFRTRIDYIYTRFREAHENQVVFTALQVVATSPVDCEETLHKLQHIYIRNGYEGAMLRRGNYGYEFGKRSKSLLKVKTFKDGEFEIVDFREGKGKCAGTCVFICKAPSGGEFEVYAPGTAEEKAQIWKDRKNYLGKKLTVKYQEMTTSEKPVPRFPVALRLYQQV
jgi:DNA ligase-1